VIHPRWRQRRRGCESDLPRGVARPQFYQSSNCRRVRFSVRTAHRTIGSEQRAGCPRRASGRQWPPEAAHWRLWV